MKNQLLLSAAMAAVLGTLLVERADAIQAYAIEDFNNLVAFDTTTPGTVTTTAFSGATTRLDGLDFRPANGLLYGYDESSNRLVTVDPVTAVTTLVGNLTDSITTNPISPADNDLGIDFNPVADRLRFVNVSDQNWRINPGNGVTIVDGTLVYVDANANFSPTINEAAYTNNDNNAGTGTQLYYLDYNLDILATTAAPNAGQVTEVGDLGVDTESYTGFDIFTSAGGVNTAYAILSNSDNFPSLYTIDLTTGAATLVGGVGGSVFEVYSLALVPVPVPEPSSLALVLSAAIVGWTIRRGARRARKTIA